MKRHRKTMTEQQTPPKKIRKQRKPMTEEQRLAASERLEKARKSKKTSENISLHESIRDLPEDHALHPDKVKGWIKEWKERLQSIRHYKNSKEGKEVSTYYSTESYIKNMQRYLDSGVWLDMFWGENRDKRMVEVCIAPAYDKDGLIKRSKGVFYPDINMIWKGDGVVEDET